MTPGISDEDLLNDVSVATAPDVLITNLLAQQYVHMETMKEEEIQTTDALLGNFITKILKDRNTGDQHLPSSQSPASKSLSPPEKNKDATKANEKTEESKKEEEEKNGKAPAVGLSELLAGMFGKQPKDQNMAAN